MQRLKGHCFCDHAALGSSERARVHGLGLLLTVHLSLVLAQPRFLIITILTQFAFIFLVHIVKPHDSQGQCRPS